MTMPTYTPTATPSVDPTAVPSEMPTAPPSPEPTRRPTKAPTPRPTRWPTRAPTARPSEWPTRRPTFRPSHPTMPNYQAPTSEPSVVPTRWPSPSPTDKWPTRKPSEGPTGSPTAAPLEAVASSSSSTTEWPTPEPTPNPTTPPSEAPTAGPTKEPIAAATTLPIQWVVTSTTVQCPICLADAPFADPYADDSRGYAAVPLPPKDVAAANSEAENGEEDGHSALSNEREAIHSVLTPSEQNEDGGKKNEFLDAVLCGAAAHHLVQRRRVQLARDEGREEGGDHGLSLRERHHRQSERGGRERQRGRRGIL